MQKDYEQKIETANYVILSLIRELYNQKQYVSKEEANKYQQKIEQLQLDLKIIDKEQLLHKTKVIYMPYLQQLLKEKHA